MPVIVRLGNLKIHVFSDDHNPPHFHVTSPDHAALIKISDLAVLQGQITRKDLELVLEWASKKANKQLLESEWRRLNER